jgi:transposase-like protein
VSFGFLLYVWADGVYLQARVEETAECMLVLIGATLEGKKELVGFQAGVRESAQSWRELLIDIKRRGLEIAPDLAIGDGALASGRPSMRSFPAPGTSGVGFTRPPTCSTRSPSGAWLCLGGNR